MPNKPTPIINIIPRLLADKKKRVHLTSLFVSSISFQIQDNSFFTPTLIFRTPTAAP